MGFDDIECNVTSTSFFECRQAPFGFPPDCEEKQTIGLGCAGSSGNSDFCVSSCPVGQFPDSINSLCRSCDVFGCLVCPAEGVCTRCEQPLWLLNQTCVRSCPPGRYGNAESGTCRACDAACLTCADGVSGASCTSCHVTLALNDGACVEECPRDRLLWNVTSSVRVDALTSSFRGYVTSAVCVNRCPDGSYQPMTSSSRLCLPCFTTCQRCFGVADNCTDCVISDQVLVAMKGGRSCEPLCPIGQYLGVDNLCVLCSDTLCASCYVGGQFCRSCVQSHLLEMGRCKSSCSNGLYPNPGGVCLPICPRGQYPDGSRQCLQCPSPCLDCLSSSVCVTCRPGYYLLTNQRTCVSQCGRGLVQYSSTRNDDVSVRLVGGLLPVDGAVQVLARGNVAQCMKLFKFVDPETGPRWLRTLLLLLLLLLEFLQLSDFRFPKALSFLNRS